MKIVLLNNDFRAYWKGRLLYLRQFLAAKGTGFYAIELFGKDSPYSFDRYDNTESWWNCLFPTQHSNELKSNEIKKALFHLLDEIEPDIIIGPSIVFYAGALGLNWAKKHKKKFIMFDDARPGQVKRNEFIQGIKNLLIKQSDGLWFPSEEYADDYSYLDNGEMHFFFGFNAVDNQLFRPREEKDQGNKTIVCVARLVPVKNIHTLLKAWQLIEEKHTGYRLLIIGTGPEMERLKELSKELKLQMIQFEGAVDNRDLPAYYHRSEVFILPSLSESWGLVVNEAMASGLPVLLSNHVNASRSLLKEGRNGFSFDPRSVKNMKETILNYIHLPLDVKQSMAAHSLRIIESLSYEKMGMQLLEAIEKIRSSKYKKAEILASVILSRWHGRYNTAGWDREGKM